VLIIISLWLYHDGAKHYDIGYLLGLRQIRNRKQHATLAENGLFTREGAHGMMRHPLYSGSFLFIWSVLPVYHLSSFIAATVLSVYLVVGTWLEERKILAEYGVQYRRYQQEVSMLIPWKWLLKKLRGK
jgi:protein-S-isoprenylcysteine O-methyltransferase Ste14